MKKEERREKDWISSFLLIKLNKFISKRLSGKRDYNLACNRI